MNLKKNPSKIKVTSIPISKEDQFISDKIPKEEEKSIREQGIITTHIFMISSRKTEYDLQLKNSLQDCLISYGYAGENYTIDMVNEEGLFFKNFRKARSDAFVKAGDTFSYQNPDTYKPDTNLPGTLFLAQLWSPNNKPNQHYIADGMRMTFSSQGAEHEIPIISKQQEFKKTLQKMKGSSGKPLISENGTINKLGLNQYYFVSLEEIMPSLPDSRRVQYGSFFSRVEGEKLGTQMLEFSFELSTNIWKAEVAIAPATAGGAIALRRVGENCILNEEPSAGESLDPKVIKVIKDDNFILAGYMVSKEGEFLCNNPNRICISFRSDSELLEEYKTFKKTMSEIQKSDSPIMPRS